MDSLDTKNMNKPQCATHFRFNQKTGPLCSLPHRQKYLTNVYSCITKLHAESTDNHSTSHSLILLISKYNMYSGWHEVNKHSQRRNIPQHNHSKPITELHLNIETCYKLTSLPPSWACTFVTN